VDRLSQQLHKLERDLDSAKSAEASARAEAASETKRRALQTAEAEAAAANTRSEHSQVLSRLQACVKKLEVRTVGLTFCVALIASYRPICSCIKQQDSESCSSQCTPLACSGPGRIHTL